MIITVLLITVKKHISLPYMPFCRESLSRLWFIYMIEYSKTTAMIMQQYIPDLERCSWSSLVKKILDNMYIV